MQEILNSTVATRASLKSDFTMVDASTIPSLYNILTHMNSALVQSAIVMVALTSSMKTFNDWMANANDSLSKMNEAQYKKDNIMQYINGALMSFSATTLLLGPSLMDYEVTENPSFLQGIQHRLINSALTISIILPIFVNGLSAYYKYDKAQYNTKVEEFNTLTDTYQKNIDGLLNHFDYNGKFQEYISNVIGAIVRGVNECETKNILVNKK